MDSQTITLIATTAVGLLIPYLVKAGEAAAKNVGEDVHRILDFLISSYHSTALNLVQV